MALGLLSLPEKTWREIVSRLTENENAACLVHAFEESMPRMPFDVIVFNEAFLHARRPLSALTRYSKWLRAERRVVLPLCEYGCLPLIWPRSFRVTDHRHAENARERKRDVKVLVPIAASP